MKKDYVALQFLKILRDQIKTYEKLCNNKFQSKNKYMKKVVKNIFVTRLNITIYII